MPEIKIKLYKSQKYILRRKNCLRNFFYITFISLLALGLSTSVVGASQWKFNNGLPEGRGESKQLETFAAEVSDLTNGSLKIDVFHGGSLNLKDNDVARWLPQGAVEMGLVWANYLGRDVPALNAVMIQGSVGSSEELITALPEIQEIYKEVLTELDIVPTGFMALPILKASIFCRENLFAAWRILKLENCVYGVMIRLKLLQN